MRAGSMTTQQHALERCQEQYDRARSGTDAGTPDCNLMLEALEQSCQLLGLLEPGRCAKDTQP